MVQSENLSVLAYANGFTLWHYKDTATLATITASTYFTPVSKILNQGDMVMVNAGTDVSESAVLVVSASSESSVTFITL